MIIDASVILSALFPDESQSQAQAVLRDHIVGHISLMSPTLLQYELTNAVWQGVHRQRIQVAQAKEILTTVDALNISQHPVNWQPILNWASQFDRSAYDASYMSLAHIKQTKLITADRRLFNAVRHSIDWVIWIEEYETPTM